MRHRLAASFFRALRGWFGLFVLVVACVLAPGGCTCASIPSPTGAHGHAMACLSRKAQSPTAPSGAPGTATAPAGTIPGTFAVTSTGEATYTMPLAAVPGRAGVEPQLAITYDGAGDGVLGAGFSLAGLSAITRCASNLAQDSAIREVRYDPLDKLCLDGKRLVPTGGDATTVEYRTLPDSQVKVVGHFVPRGTTSTDALFFEAFTPSGLIVEYGREDSGKPLTSSGAPEAWLATKAYDRRGNAMSYAYCIDADPNDGHAVEYAIDQIRYTSFSGLTDQGASRAVTFVYAEKDPADVRTRYAGGMALQSALRLDKIQMLGPGDALVRTYAFTYGLGPTTNRTLLAEVEECASDGVCKPPARFTYTSSATGFKKLTTSIPSPTSTLASPMLADLDGDGLDDLILPDTDKALTTPASPITNWTVAHNAGASASSSYFSSPALGLSEDWPAVAHPTAPADPTQIQPELGTALDFDQDGRTDLFLHDVWGTSPNWIVLLAQPDHTFKQHDTGIPRPFPVGSYPTPPTITSNRASVHLADVNGDGVPDLIQCVDHGAVADPSLPSWAAHLWKPQGGATPAGWSPDSETISPLDTYPCDTELYTLDINGDGKVDLVVLDRPAEQQALQSYDWVTRLADDTWGAWATGLERPIAGGRIVFLDVNGDGLPDAVTSGAEDHTLQTHFNTGAYTTGWGYPGNLFTGPAHDALAHDPLVDQDKFFHLATPLDFDGDGRQDLLMPVAEDTDSDPTWMILKAQEAGNGGPTFTLVDAGIPFEPLLAGSSITLADPHGPRIGDVNGDGAPDVVLTMGGVFNVFENVAHDQDLLAAVSDGMNGHDPSDPGFVPNVSITYGHLTDPSITRGTPAQESDAYLAHAGIAPACAYPVACAVGPRRQVTGYTTNNGADAPRHFGIRYRDGRYHRLGRGFLGFAEKIVTDLDTLAGTATFYDNTTAREAGSVTVFPFAFQVAHEQRWVPGLPTQPDPTQIELAFTDVDRAFVPNYGGASYFTLPTVHHVRTFEGSFPSAGASTPEAYAAQVASTGGATLLRDTTRTVSKADAFGNVLVEDTRTAGVDLTLHVERTFKNDTDLWVLGQLQTQTECSTAAGMSQCRTLTRHTTLIGETADESTSTDDGIPDTQLTVAYVRDAYGNVIQTTQDDAFGHHRVSKTTYDPEGIYPIASTNALGQTTQTSYDPRFGTLNSITDPNGLTTTRAYDGFGRLGLETSPDGAQTTVTLSRTKDGGQNKDAWRVTARSTTTGGTDDTVEYDSLSRPVRWWWHGPEPTARARIMQEVAYDALGEHVARRSVPVSEDTPESKVLNDRYEYDALGREVLHTMPWGATVQSAYEGMVVKVTDPLSNVTTTVLDPLGRPATVTDALQAATAYTYGPFGAPQTVTTPGGALTRTTRDAFGRVRQLDDPDRGTTTSQHDGFGELMTSTDALGRTVTYQYDALGRTLARKDQHGAENLITTWTWDTAPHGIGKLAALVSPDGAKTYTYTALGQPETLTLAINGESDTLQATLGYDTLGRVSTITYPTPAGAAPFVVAQDYDAFGHVVTVRDAKGSTVHWRLTDTDEAGRYKSETFGNGVTSSRAYYPDKQSLASIATTLGATTIQSLSYDYDARRDLTSRTDALQMQNPTERFRYDPVKRLTCAYFSTIENDTAPCALSYGYDPSGNLIGKSDVGTLAYKDPKHPHAVTSAGSDAFGYDAVGNQITRPGGATITYTPFDLPKTITQPAGAIRLDYDGDQQRIRKTSPDKETLYFEGLYERVTTAAPAAVTHTYYIRSPERVVAVVTQGGSMPGPLYVHVDHLGSIDKLTNAKGAVVESRSYDPFGQRRNTFWGMPPPASFPSLTSVGFTGQESDDELGLVNAKGRMYDPKVGRFLTTDPIVQAPLSAQSWNRYSYVWNNPLSFTDPSGFEGEDPSPPPDNCASCIWAPSYGWVKSVGGVDADGTPLIRAVVVKPVEQKVDGAQVGVAPKPVDVGTTGSASGTALEAVRTSARDWTSHPAAQAAGGVAEGTYIFVGSNARGMRILIDPLGWMQQTQLAMLQNAITGYRQDGVIGGAVAAFNTVNPLYALAVTGVDAKEAWDKGDYWKAAKGATILVLTVASVFVGGKGGGASEGVALAEGEAAAAGMHAHHIFPQQFARQFEAAGINIEEFRVQLSEGTHLGQLHSSGGIPGVGPGGLWNEAWRQYFATEAAAGRVLTREGLLEQAAQMVADFSVPYYSPVP